MKLLCAILFSLMTVPAHAASPVVIHSDWGDMEEVRQIDNFYVSAAPDNAALAKFREAGGQLVVDLRTPKEMNCGTRSEAAKLGMDFRAIPYDSKDAISPKLLATFAKAVDDAHGKPVLVSCQTGNRAAALLTAYLVKHGEVSAKDAPAEAKSFGLRSEGVKKNLAKFLASQ